MVKEIRVGRDVLVTDGTRTGIPEALYLWGLLQDPSRPQQDLNTIPQIISEHRVDTIDDWKRVGDC